MYVYGEEKEVDIRERGRNKMRSWSAMNGAILCSDASWFTRRDGGEESFFGG